MEQAGFLHEELVDIDSYSCNTLQLNRPKWAVTEMDLRKFDGSAYKGVDLLAGGLPCPPFSIAGKQLGTRDERNLFPEAVRLADEIRPQAVMIENVRGILSAVFEDHRSSIKQQMHKLGYKTDWRLPDCARSIAASQYCMPVCHVNGQPAVTGHKTPL